MGYGVIKGLIVVVRCHESNKYKLGYRNNDWPILDISSAVQYMTGLVKIIGVSVPQKHPKMITGSTHEGLAWLTYGVQPSARLAVPARVPSLS